MICVIIAWITRHRGTSCSLPFCASLSMAILLCYRCPSPPSLCGLYITRLEPRRPERFRPCRQCRQRLRAAWIDTGRQRTQQCVESRVQLEEQNVYFASHVSLAFCRLLTAAVSSQTRGKSTFTNSTNFKFWEVFSHDLVMRNKQYNNTESMLVIQMTDSPEYVSVC